MIEYKESVKLRFHNVQQNLYLKAILHHPKLVVLKGSLVIIFNLDDGENGQGLEENGIRIDVLVNIIDAIVVENFLWVLLESGKLLLVDLCLDKSMEVILENPANYKIRQLKHQGGSLYFLSESGDYLMGGYSSKEIKNNILADIPTYSLNVKNINVLPKFDDTTKLNGISIEIQDGNIVWECPVTGLQDVIPSPITDHSATILQWEEIMLLVDKQNIWFIDSSFSSLVRELHTKEYEFYPVATYQNMFFFLVIDDNEIQVKCLKKLSLQNKGLKEHIPSKMKLSEDMLKAELNAITEELLQQQVQSNLTGEVLSKIKYFFEEIKDLDYLFQIVYKLTLGGITSKHMVYILQKKMFIANNAKNITAINELIIKLDLLELISFRNIQTYKDIDVIQSSLIDLCVMFVSNSDFDLACMCWLRYVQIKTTCSAQSILKILDAVPHNTKMGSLMIWLRNFVPPLLDENPFHIDIIVRWATERVFLLEKSAYWPKIGLKFIDDVKVVLGTSLTTISIIPTSMDDLDLLKDRIMYIMELKDKYKINMLLAELNTQSPTEVLLIMLHRCYNEDLQSFLKDYLPNIVTRYNLELDDVLQTYVQGEAASGGGNIDETRLSLLLNSFRGPQNKLDCLLSVLRVLDVPWNKVVHKLATEAAAMTENDFTLNETERNLSRDIEEELNYANLKVVLKKYNFSAICTDYVLVLHKIVNTPVVCLSDLRIVMNVIVGYENYGSMLYIDRCLRDYDTREALKYFKTLNQRECRLLVGSLITKFEQLLDQDSDVGVQKCYMDFFKGSQVLHNDQIVKIENMYHLKHTHNIQKCLNDMYREEAIHLDLIYGQKDNITPLQSRSLTRLLNLQLNKNSALFDLLHKTSSATKIRKNAETLLLIFSNTEKHTSRQVLAILNHLQEDNNILELIDCCKIFTELLCKCNEEHVYFLTKILHVLNTILASSVTVKKLSAVWKFNYIFLPVLSTHGVNNLVKFYASCIADEILDSETLKQMCNCNDFLPVKIAAEALICDDSNNAVSTDELLKAFRRKVTKIVVCQEIDELLLTTLLLILNVSNDNQIYWLLDILKAQNDTIPQNVVQYISSSTTKTALSLNDEISRNAVSYPPQYILKNKFNLNLAEIAMPDVTEDTCDVKVILFYLLRQYPEMSMDRLVEVCRTLDVSINDGLSLQLVAVLSSWELSYSTFTNELGRRKINIKADEKGLVNKCIAIWESIRNKDFLKDIINDFWKNGEVSLHGKLVSINPYYYEVYLCMYKLLQTDSENKYAKEYYLLNFLKEYNRSSTPQQYEFEMFSSKGMFPEIGYYRLPFHLFMKDDMWSNLKSEITLETYELWLPAVSLLSLDSDNQTSRDMICSNALKQTMKTRQVVDQNPIDTKESDSWRLTTREEPLLRAAHRCVKHIANMEWAGACLFYVLQGCARGADQVAAAQLCYQFAQKWDALQPGNKAVRKMERLYSTLSTRHVLHKIDWATEELVQLTTEPVQLIRSMYMHPKLVDKMARYDINQAISEIADKNGINISSIRIQILENILEKECEDMVSKQSVGLDLKKLTTAKYILKATCPKMGAIYLSRIAFDDETDLNKYKKIRALQCLMSIVDSDASMKASYRDRDVLWTSLLEMLYATNFEKIDMPWAIETFKQDKLKALEQVCSSIGNNVDALKVAANLSKTYGNLHTCHSIIPALVRASLSDHVIPLLMRCLAPPDEIIIKAWRFILLAPFESADFPITDRQKANCIRALNLLPLCPVINDEVLKEIWKHCVRCKSYGIGCLMLPYMTYETRQSLAEIKKIDKRNLIASLKNLQTETYLVSGAMYVLETMVSKTYR